MFYSQFILAKKGPLGTIWIAAHLERKLRKNQVAETDIGVTVDSILFPEVPIALRLSGHLLLGVVRIYSRQVNYLFNDCSETLLKIKQAFHSTAVDLPPEATTAPFHSITLPETFDFDELELLPDSESSFLGPNGKYVDHHVTTREQITLQDRIENNPYLGSSQFGPDERFGDGNCSPMGLDFDEEFLAEKPHSSAASTSTPLLKEDILPSPSGCGDEGIRMDIDDHYKSSEPIFGLHKADSNEQRTTVVFRSDEIEADGQQNTFSLTPLVDPLNEPAAMEAVSSKVSDSVLFKNDIPSFHAYTPHIFDARTPDLNQEFCPPDEPSTPALPDETSLPMYKESNIESTRSPPVMLGHFERNTSTELHPGSLPPKQVSVLASLEQPKQELPSAQYFLPSIRQASAPSSGPAQANTAVFLQQMQSHLQTSFVDSMQHSIPPFPTQSLGQGVSSITNDSSSTHFQGFPLHQASSVGVTRDAFLVSSLTQRDEKNLLQPVSSLEETRDSVSAPFQIFPQPAFLQQSRAAASDEAVFLSAGTSNPLLPSLVTSMASLHQPTGSSSAALSHQCPLSMSNQEVSSLFQQHRTTASSDYAQASYRGTGEVSSVLQPHSMAQYSMANRISTSPFVPKASLLPSFSASSGSILPLAKDSSLFGHTETMDLDTQAMHKTQDLASSKGLFWHPAAQQLSSSSTAPMPSILPSVHVKDIPQFETLRSAADSQRKESDFLFLQKDMLDERIPALEVDRVKAHIMSFDRVSKGAIQPEFDKTPTFREETPLTATKPSRLSTRSLDSLPGDDDVLASILGRRTNPFKVISTPKENLVVKRPKVALRSVLKKRKNDFDTLAVLHGDVIRQQLAYTEDIRRERRKVPCTRREVWHLNQETQCQQNFDEPSLLGLSIDLHDLYHDILGVNESRFSSSDLIGATTATPVFEPERSRWDTKSMSELPSELVNKGSSKHDCHVCPNEVLSTPENALLEGSMEQVKGDIKTAPEILIGSSIRMASMKDLSPQAQVDDGTSSQNGSVTEELVFPMVDTEPVAGEVWNKMVSAELRASEDIDTNGIVSRETEASEPAMEQNIVLDAAVESIGQVQVDTLICNSTDVENGGGIVSATVGKDSGAIELQGDTGTVVEDRQHGLGLHEQDAHQEIAIPNKDADLGSLEVLPDAGNVTERPLVKFTDRDEGNAESGEKQSTLNVSEEMVDFCGDDEPFGFMANERDTDFLAADDDMAYAEVDGYSSDEHDALIQDNGGWSARSRNVGRYLKTVFEGMDGSSRRSKDQGHAVLGLERLLAQKTKKEAARMFFETLVLKTRDYIQVEQNTAYEDIHLYPRTKLMKTNF